jgi:CDP-diglyceride synthetase
MGRVKSFPVTLALAYIAVAITAVVVVTLVATEHEASEGAFVTFLVFVLVAVWSTFAYSQGYADGENRSKE